MLHKRQYNEWCIILNFIYYHIHVLNSIRTLSLVNCDPLNAVLGRLSSGVGILFFFALLERGPDERNKIINHKTRNSVKKFRYALKIRKQEKYLEF